MALLLSGMNYWEGENMDATDRERQTPQGTVTAAPEPAPEVREKPVDSAAPAPADIDPPHESGYGFGV